MPNTPITTIGFVTKNRAVTLARALESYIQNTKTYGRQTTFVVMDDSESVQVRADYKQALQTLKARYTVNIVYAGIEEKTRYAEALVQESKLPKEIVDFALGDPEHCGCSTGANRNALFLHTVGEKFFCADDDTLCQIVGPLEPEGGLELSAASNPTELWAFPNHEAARHAIHVVDKDILGMHEEFLGVGMDRCTDPFEESDVDFKNVSPWLAQKLLTEKGRIRLSWTGIFGDSGFSLPSYLLWLRGSAREAAMRSDVIYDAVCRSRQILRVTRKLVIGGEGGFFQSVGLAFDNETLLPPYTPVYRGQDGLFGLLLMRCFEEYIAYVPWAILHDPQPARENKREDITLGGSQVQFHNVIKTCIEAFRPPEGSEEGVGRLIALGEFLIELAGKNPAEFARVVQSGLSEKNAKTTESLKAALQAHNGTPRYWASDLKAYLKRMRVAERRPDFGVPEDVRNGRNLEEARELTQRLVLRFGRLLTVWPDIVAAAERLREKGIRLAQPV